MNKPVFRANYMEYFRGGWDAYKKQPLLLSGATLAVGVCMSLLSPIFMASTVLAAHLLAGLYTLVIRVKSDEDCDFTHFFAGFSQFVPLLVLSLLTSVMISVGLLLLVLPGIYLSLAYAFSLLLVIREGLGPWQAMEESRRIITAHFMDYLIFAVLALIVNVVAAIPFGLGLFVSIPVTLAAQYALYVELRQADRDSGHLETTAELAQ